MAALTPGRPGIAARYRRARPCLWAGDGMATGGRALRRPVPAGRGGRDTARTMSRWVMEDL